MNVYGVSLEEFHEFCRRAQKNLPKLAEQYGREIEILKYEYVPQAGDQPQGVGYETTLGREVPSGYTITVDIEGVGRRWLCYRYKSQPSRGYEHWWYDEPTLKAGERVADVFQRIQRELEAHTEREQNKRFVKRHYDQLSDDDLSTLVDFIRARQGSQ